MLSSIWEPEAILASLALALVVDALLGDPGWLWRRLPHPVALAGKLIHWAERSINRPEFGAGLRRLMGAAVLLVLLVLTTLVGIGLSRLFALVPGGWILEGIAAAVLLAQRSLYDHVRAVERAFAGGGIAGARQAVAHIVGRDPDALDEAGICRAAIESLAENHSDGVVAPVFWFLLFGLPGLLAYKILNTADSMIGYRDDRHRDFGWAAARFDDVANYLPARIDAVLLVAAGALSPGRRDGAGAKAAWRAARQDGPRHESVNAGWPEAAMAGALGLALAGPRTYGGVTSDGAWMNEEGEQDAAPVDIGRAVVVYVAATGVLWLAVALGLVILLAQF